MFNRQWFPKSYYPPNYFPATGSKIVAPALPGKPGTGGHINLGIDFESPIGGHMPGWPVWITPPAPPIAKPAIVEYVKGTPASVGNVVHIGGFSPPQVGAPVNRIGPTQNLILLGTTPIDQDGIPLGASTGNLIPSMTGALGSTVVGSAFDNLYIDGDINRSNYGILFYEQPVIPGPAPGSTMVGDFVLTDSGDFIVTDTGDFWTWD